MENDILVISEIACYILHSLDLFQGYYEFYEGTDKNDKSSFCIICNIAFRALLNIRV